MHELAGGASSSLSPSSFLLNVRGQQSKSIPVRLLSKYYNRDYHTALFHFEQLQAPERFSVLYEYIDCYFLLGQYNKALDVLEAFGNHELSDNVLYLKSKIYF